MGVESALLSGGWQGLLEACVEGVAVTEAGTFAAVSDGFAEMHDTTPGQLRGRP